MIEHKDVLQGKSICYDHQLRESNTKRKRYRLRFFKWTTDFLLFWFYWICQFEYQSSGFEGGIKVHTFENAGRIYKKSSLKHYRQLQIFV